MKRTKQSSPTICGFFNALCLVSLVACGKTSTKSSLSFEDAPIADQKVTFEELREKVLTPHCIRCHGEYLQEKGVRRVIYPQHPELSHLFLHMEDGSMPRDAGAVSTADLELTRAYINQLPTGLPGNHNADDYFPNLPLPPEGRRDP